MNETPTIPAQRAAQVGSGRLVACLDKVWLQCLVLVFVGFLVRLPGLQGQFLWDDDYLASGNPFIKSPLLIPEAFRHYLFLDSSSAHYRPVQNISLIFDYLVWNSEPYGFHLTNVALHLGSGLLLFFLLRKLFFGFLNSKGEQALRPSRTVTLSAFLVALLWIVHPVHSAAVDYISGRADSLAFFFGCAGWLLFLRARTRPSLFRRLLLFGAAGLCGILALCSREIGIVWLCLFLLHLLVFEKGICRRTKIVSLGCCLLLALSYVALRQLPEHRPPAGASYGWSQPIRTALMLRALGDYGRLMIFPSTLYMERTVLDPDNYRDTRTWRQSVATEYLSILGLAVLSGLAYGACRKSAGQSLRIFGASWFLLGYLPVSNLVELNATVAEHWLYLPSVGFLIFLIGCALDLPVHYRKAAAAFACVAVVGLSARAFIRSSDWVTPETFYKRTLAAGGSSTRVAVNLGLIYSNRGDYARAEAIFRRVLEVSPDYPIARNNLADVLYRQGKKAEGEAIFASSTRAAAVTRKEHPRTWIAALNLAHLKHNEKFDYEALAILEQARLDYPKIWDIIRFEAELLRQTKGPEVALTLVKDFAHENWWHQGASLALARLLAEKGDVEGAVTALRFASWLDVHDAEALNLLASIRLRQNRLEEARLAQTRAVGRQPDEPRQYRLLSDILFKMGRGAEAQLAIAKIARLEALVQSQAAVN